MVDYNFINYNMLSINMQTIMFFIAVAEKGNMTAVANDLHVTQPFLSQRITSLENTLNLHLFERKYHRMQLTKEGKILLEAWSKIVNTYQRSIDDARAVSNAEKKQISIGIWDNLYMSAQVEIANALFSANPDVRPNLKLVNRVNAISDLLNGRIDLAMVTDYHSFFSTPNLYQLPICELAMYANINKRNPLSKEGDLNLFDLKNEKWICTKANTPTGYQTFLNEKCKELGFQPQFISTDDTPQQRFMLLFNEAISVCPAVCNDPSLDDIVMIKLDDISVPVIYMWHKDAKPEIKAFAVKTADTLGEILVRRNDPKITQNDGCE